MQLKLSQPKFKVNSSYRQLASSSTTQPDKFKSFRPVRETHNQYNDKKTISDYRPSERSENHKSVYAKDSFRMAKDNLLNRQRKTDRTIQNTYNRNTYQLDKFSSIGQGCRPTVYNKDLGKSFEKLFDKNYLKRRDKVLQTQKLCESQSNINF